MREERTRIYFAMVMNGQSACLENVFRYFRKFPLWKDHNRAKYVPVFGLVNANTIPEEY